MRIKNLKIHQAYNQFLNQYDTRKKLKLEHNINHYSSYMRKVYFKELTSCGRKVMLAIPIEISLFTYIPLSLGYPELTCSFVASSLLSIHITTYLLSYRLEKNNIYEKQVHHYKKLEKKLLKVNQRIEKRNQE